MALPRRLALRGQELRPAKWMVSRSFTSACKLRTSSYRTPPVGWVPTPYVTETIGGAWHTYDIFSRLLKERIVSINGPIDDTLSASIVAQLLFLEAENPDKPISLYINSPGGIVTAGLAIYDTLTYIRPPITTICLGQAASMGSLLLAAGSPGMRLCLPNASIMVHQPSGGYAGQATDIAIHAREILRLRKRLNGIYLQHLNKAITDRTAKAETDSSSTSTSSTPSSPASNSDSSIPTPVRIDSQRFIDLDAPQHDELSAPRKAGIVWTLQEIEQLMERDRFLDPQEALEMGIIDRVLTKRSDI